MHRIGYGLRQRLVSLPRRYKRLLQVTIDIVLVWLALWLAFVLRLGGIDGIEPFDGHAWLFLTAPVIAIPLYVRHGMYRAVMRYLGNDALVAIFKAVSLSSLFLSLVIYWVNDQSTIVPRSAVFNYWWLSLFLIGGLRLLMRQFFLGDWFSADYMRRVLREEGLPKVAVYGAGAAGNQLVAALRLGRAMRPVAFIDDDNDIANRNIAGLKVYKPKHLQQMLDETGASEVLLAIPSASRARRREILAELEPFALHVRSVPGIMDLASGRVRVQDVREVDIADLLGRDPVTPQPELFARCIRDKVVLVTGAGGSIGAELCRQILTQAPQKLILFEQCEFNLYRIQQDLQQRLDASAIQVEVMPILGSVRDPARVLEVMTTWGVATVYHAAAYKHVPMVEHNVSEGVLNNVMGTVNTAQAAIQAGVQHFVLISTDKAVRPTNVMGATKRMAEMLLQALSQEMAPQLFEGVGGVVNHVNRTRFSMVRFGNVLGSSGSVIPLFHQQIKRGGPVTVTHLDITRYFMTIPEAAQLVIQAGAMGVGGDVFVLDMGEPVRIVELAEKMINLSGFSVRNAKHPAGDIAIEFTGLRPGEKLYEELLIGDNVAETEHPMILRAQEDHLSWREFRQVLEVLQKAAQTNNLPHMRQILSSTVNGYQPMGEIVDWVHTQQLDNSEIRL